LIVSVSFSLPFTTVTVAEGVPLLCAIIVHPASIEWWCDSIRGESHEGVIFGSSIKDCCHIG
jgi:hypothetical protein